MTNQQRKDWLYDNLERDTNSQAAAERNVAKHGAEKILDIMGPTTWLESYGQTPFDRTYMLAADMRRAGVLS